MSPYRETFDCRACRESIEQRFADYRHCVDGELHCMRESIEQQARALERSRLLFALALTTAGCVVTWAVCR